MTTMDAVRLSDELLALVDARLDTIDRMLLGRAPRADRLAIVREVEAQIHDLLAERGHGELGRDDVLAVLARLDPPEAYLPEEPSMGPASVRRPMPSRPAAPTSDSRMRIARTSGILGICALAMILLIPVVYLVAALTESELVLIGALFGEAGSIFLLGALAIVLAGYARLRGAWAVVGLVTGVISVLFSLAGGLLLLLELL
jgi:hypothetical protein